MEALPVEIVGNILSCLGTARDVVIASATCRKWQDAWRNHLHTLTFDCCDWPLYEFSKSKLEILITQTIFQTKGLQRLSIIMDGVAEFCAGSVIAWLMYTRETLRELHYNVTTRPDINILEKCGRQKLEVLSLAHNTITGVESDYQNFLCLRSLSLNYVSIAAFDLSLLLTACPKIETLTLVGLDIFMTDSPATIDLSSSSVKDISVEAITLDKFVLEAGSLEKLHLKDCSIEVFELVGKGTLRFLKIDDSSVIHLETGEHAENLEIVDVSNFTIMWEKFHHMISRSSKLRKLRLWDAVLDDEDDFVDMDSISSCFPLLTHLSLNYELREPMTQYCLEGSFVFENVVVLELGWMLKSDLSMFSMWVSEFLERCPRLRKLVIHGVVSETKTHKECRLLAKFTSSIVRLMRKYLHVEVEFDYE